MKDFDFGPYRIRTDPARTRAYYDSFPLPWVTCDCAGCRNYLRAAETFPESVADFFRELGLDPRKPAEICTYDGSTDHIFTSAWYHVCGELVSGGAVPGDGPPLELADGVSASCDAECDLLPDDFPRPCFQVEFWFDRPPWLLGEPNPYSFSGQENVV